MKFDNVVGNPPYNSPSDGNNDLLWVDFVDLAFSCCENFAVLVHPPGWRKPQTNYTRSKDLQPKMIKNIKYLSIHDSKDGIEIFGAGTRFDWYLIDFTSESNNFQVSDVFDKHHIIDKGDWTWIPNANFSLIKKLIILDTNFHQKCPLLYSTEYHTCNDNVFEDESMGDYKIFHSSGFRFTNRKGISLFGVSKVLFSDSDSERVLIDLNGRYGATEHAFAIYVDGIEEARKIKKAYLSDKFQSLLRFSLNWGNFQIDYRMFNNFRKDWYKIILAKK